MQIEYRVFDPRTGEYTSYSTLEEATAVAKEKAWALYNLQSGSIGLKRVTITDEGAEIWSET
jgi:hypothetical protein